MLLNPRTEGVLAHVHGDLVRVVRAAPQLPQPFVLVQGIRSPAAEAIAVATGHSCTLHSRHFADPHFDDLAMAFDVAAWIDGGANFAPGREVEVFGQIASQILGAAKILGVRMQWGGAAVGAWTDGVVSHFRDFGHFQLDPSAYA
jgi:peptidoglycan L-alanyl-D-glutamate endopeptidase CwlK